MVDKLTKSARSRHMARIRNTGTNAELVVRRVAHRAGYRFRIARSDLPGRPDVVFPRHHAVVFVHGCFWHRHEGCRRTSDPATNVEFWRKKFAANVARDKTNLANLAALGWRTLVIWECETRDQGFVERQLREFLGP